MHIQPHVTAALLLLAGVAAGAESANPVPRAPGDGPGAEVRAALAEPMAGYKTRNIEGWTTHFSTRLLQEQKEAVEAMMPLLRSQLSDIVRRLPPAAVRRLREVPLWFSPEYPGVPGRAEYHPGAGWLRDNGRNPAMVKGVEVTDVRNFARETNRMPCFMLHELAHAYHDRVLSFNHPGILAAYQHAKKAGLYDRVERHHGNGRPNSFERAYAMTDEKEYFAESTEAFFGTNDFHPFNSAQLAAHDPTMFDLLQKLWNPPVPK